jgi:hypothetical protein
MLFIMAREEKKCLVASKQTPHGIDSLWVIALPIDMSGEESVENTLKAGMEAMEPIRPVRLSALLSMRNEEIPEHTSDNP